MARHHLVFPRSLQSGFEFILKVEIHLPQHFVGEFSSVGKSKQTDFSFAQEILQTIRFNFQLNAGDDPDLKWAIYHDEYRHYCVSSPLERRQLVIARAA